MAAWGLKSTTSYQQRALWLGLWNPGNTIKDTQSKICDFATSIPSNEQETILMRIIQELLIEFFMLIVILHPNLAPVKSVMIQPWYTLLFRVCKTSSCFSFLCGKNVILLFSKDSLKVTYRENWLFPCLCARTGSPVHLPTQKVWKRTTQSPSLRGDESTGFIYLLLYITLLPHISNTNTQFISQLLPS